MSKFTESFRNIFKIEELRTRLLFTAGLLIVVRIGSHVTLPGVDAGVPLTESVSFRARVPRALDIWVLTVPTEQPSTRATSR